VSLWGWRFRGRCDRRHAGGIARSEPAFVGTVGKRDAVVGQDGMELVGEGGDNAAQERGAGRHCGARMQLRRG
jgi:hypothetical protein